MKHPTNTTIQLKQTLALCFSLLLLCLYPLTASAHLDNGDDRVVGNYLVDFGYTPGAPTAQEKMTLAFNLVDNRTHTLVIPQYVWVRIAQDDGIIFSGTLFPAGGQNVTLAYTFPRSGNYEITTSFHDDTQRLAEATFPLTVEPETTRSPTTTYVYEQVMPWETKVRVGVLALLSGLAIGYIWKSKKPA